jgi:hypothetical protein
MLGFVPVLIVVRHEIIAESRGAATNSLLRNQPKPAFDLIDSILSGWYCDQQRLHRSRRRSCSFWRQRRCVRLSERRHADDVQHHFGRPGRFGIHKTRDSEASTMPKRREADCLIHGVSRHFPFGRFSGGRWPFFGASAGFLDIRRRPLVPPDQRLTWTVFSAAVSLSSAV